MKTFLTIFVVLISTFAFSQNSEYKKIEAELNKYLKESYALKGLYDPPSYSFRSVSIADNGELTVVYTEADFTEKYNVKDASIGTAKMQVILSDQNNEITFFTKNNDAVASSLRNLQKLLNK